MVDKGYTSYLKVIAADPQIEKFRKCVLESII